MQYLANSGKRRIHLRNFTLLQTIEVKETSVIWLDNVQLDDKILNISACPGTIQECVC